LAVGLPNFVFPTHIFRGHDLKLDVLATSPKQVIVLALGSAHTGSMSVHCADLARADRARQPANCYHSLSERHLTQC